MTGLGITIIALLGTAWATSRIMEALREKYPRLTGIKETATKYAVFFGAWSVTAHIVAGINSLLTPAIHLLVASIQEWWPPLSP